jgi:RimJ/RimL family protein N-acetyltransferase
VVEAATDAGLVRVWATVGAWNTGSLRVLDKLGFARERVEHLDDREIIWARLDLSR